jgi:hypothetical protein
MRHLETCELLHYVNLSDIPDGESVERYVEIANNLRDLTERLRGGTLRNRANYFWKYAVIVPGEPIVVNDYLDLYKTDKKDALQRVTNEIKKSYEQCIKEYHDGYR